jgi:hypothetical protein
MAYNTTSNFATSQQCGEDLSQNQFCFVKLGSDELLYAATNTDHALGILTDIPTAGALGQFSGTVAVSGLTRVAVGGVYPVGTFVVPYTDGTTAGLAYSVADAGSSNDVIRARLLQPSTAAGDIVACELLYNPFGDVTGGVQGITGVQGIRGTTGVQGLTGVGYQGLTGVRGLTGVQGITGLIAPQGTTGIQGLTGVWGLTGVQGITGVIFSTGGVTGPSMVASGTITALVNGVPVILLCSATN